MQLQKLIGFQLDTNQFTSKIIENKLDAKVYFDKLVKKYGIEILDYMFLNEANVFTTYKSNGLSLASFLKNRN